MVIARNVTKRPCANYGKESARWRAEKSYVMQNEYVSGQYYWIVLNGVSVIGCYLHDGFMIHDSGHIYSPLELDAVIPYPVGMTPEQISYISQLYDDKYQQLDYLWSWDDRSPLSFSVEEINTVLQILRNKREGKMKNVLHG